MKRRQKLKKLLAILLTVVLSMSMVNMSAFAGEEDPVESGSTRTLTSGTEAEGDYLHGDEGYSPESELTCGLEEHTHTGACYTWEKRLSCGKIEGEDDHVHGDECYSSGLKLTCGLEEHTHTDACYGEETETGNSSSQPADNSGEKKETSGDVTDGTNDGSNSESDIDTMLPGDSPAGDPGADGPSIDEPSTIDLPETDKPVSIGDIGYDDLQAAFNAVGDDGTINVNQCH